MHDRRWRGSPTAAAMPAVYLEAGALLYSGDSQRR